MYNRVSSNCIHTNIYVTSLQMCGAWLLGWEVWGPGAYHNTRFSHVHWHLCQGRMFFLVMLSLQSFIFLIQRNLSVKCVTLWEAAMWSHGCNLVKHWEISLHTALLHMVSLIACFFVNAHVSLSATPPAIIIWCVFLAHQNKKKRLEVSLPLDECPQFWLCIL